ncbi:MAG: peptide chain release factor N(5)-glutamine methyltransferase [Hyphomicrobium sp.]
MIANVSSTNNFVGLPLSAVRRILSTQLAGAGIEDPDYESRLMVQMALGIDAVNYIVQENRRFSSDESNSLRTLLKRRLAREPLSRIEGVKKFYGRNYLLSPSVLDPRPETETLIDLILELANTSEEKEWPRSILDVGTGSGCILLSLLAELPCAHGVGTDISQAALETARMNALYLKVEQRVSFKQCCSLEGISSPFDVLVSNPPYIPSRQLSALEPEVRNFDPHLALDGGEDGFFVYRQIVEKLTVVVPSGWAVFEVGFDQAFELVNIIQNGLKERIKRLIIRKDLSGITRCVAVQTHN